MHHYLDIRSSARAPHDDDTLNRIASLGKVIVCKDFNAAVALVEKIRGLSESLNHHPTLSINSKRVCEQLEGCEVHVQVSTYSA